MTDLSRTLADLSPEKRALLALRLRQKGAAPAQAEAQAIPRRPTGELAPLSFAQQRFWFLHELQPEVPWYHLFKVIRLHGPLAVPVMEASLRELLRRHEALRTTFASVDGELVQVVSPEPRLHLPVADLSGLPEAAREAEMWRLALAEVGRRFDLAADPLLRGTLLRLAPGTHALIVVMHHIAGDRRSWQLFVQELAALYHAGRTAEPARLPALPLQYADFAAWQRRWLAGEVLERQLGYWRGRLGGGLPVLDLPATRPRPPVRSYRGAREVQVLPRDLSQSVRELARREGASLFMTLLAAYYALLQRYTGQDDLVVGTPISGRNRPELDGLIGCFLNTLALRADLGGDPSFRELLGRVRETASGAYAHMDLPFEALLEELRPPRDLSRTPVFQVMFVLLDLGGALMEGVSLGDLRLEEFENPQIGAEFDLTLNVDQQGDHLRCDWVYASDLLDAVQVRRLGGHFAALLAAAVAAPDRPLSDLPLLGEAESHLLLIDWNDTATTGVETALHPIHEGIAEQAARTPDAVAVVAGGESLTYRELLDRAGRLARHLRSLGAGPEVQVGLCLERNADLPVALLAVLSSGAAYLPLDPDYPSQRLAFMLEDSRVPLLIAHPATAAALPEHGARVVLLDEGWPDRLAAGPWESPAADLDRLAYVIYTSGSTGRPKGVQVPHGALANFLATMADRPGLTAADRLLAVTSLSFDIAGLEMYLPLLAGASLEQVPREVATDGARLLERLLDSTTVVQATPSTWRLLLEAGWEPARQTRPLKALCGGEALPADLAARLLSGPAVELWNLYGPTETAIWSLRLRLDPGAPVTLGRPIDNTRLFILDRGFRLVPLGVPGELGIGGDGVARGYLRRPELTAERFVPDPAADRPGARVYRTGDLARYLDDGRVEFLGRIDHQVKVRGVRIELGEIEVALAEHPAVAQAVVTARPLGGDNGDGSASRLVGYLVPRSGADPGSLSPGELRAFLQRRLPDSMLPALFVPLERLPLTPNGKIDRKALPAPDPMRPGSGREIVAPRTPVEETLAAIWRQVLRIDQVGVHDDFFELGGDSILGMQIVARAARAGLGLAPRLLFQHPTIAALALVADAAPAVHAEQGLVLGSVTPSPAQLQILQETAAADLPRRARWLSMEARRPFSAAVWERAVAELLRHHDALRLRFVRTDGGTGWKVTSAGLDGPVPFERIELPDLSNAVLVAQAERLRAGLDLAAGLLLRAALLDRGLDRPAVLLLVIHELAADRASWRWLLEDLETACEQLDRGEEVRLPAKTTSFQHWTERLEAHLGGLPQPATVHVVGGASVQSAEVVLPASETAELLGGLTAAFRVRPDEAILAAIALALAPGESGGVSIGVEDAARGLPLGGVDASRTVGCCDGDRLLRLDWPEGGGPAEALRVVKEQSRGGHPAGAPLPEILFRGLFDVPLQSPPPPGRLEIAAGLTETGLRLELRDSRPGGTAVQELAARLSESLAALAALGRDPAAGGYTPSDFPESGLGQADLDHLAESLDPALCRHIEAVYPFSPSQQGMFFFYLLNPDQPGLFVNQVRCELRGRLDAAALRNAWQTVVDRHAALRTFLLWQGWERPLQVVLDSAELPWQEEDWRALAPADQEARLAGFLAADRLRTFDLGRAPLTRVALIRTGEERHHLVWSFQQLILDGWSLPLVFQEVLALYDAAVSGRVPRLALGRPYRDYAAWVQRQSLADAEAFWRGRLAGFEEPTPLAVDRPAGDSDRRDAGRRELRLDAETTAALEALARRSRLTLNTVVEGAWALLLSRYSGEPDVLFGAVVSGRPAELPGVETMVGLFINALPERVEVGLDRPLLPWLAGIQERRVEQTRYEHLPLEQVHRWSALPWNRPLFETLFIFENYPIEDALRERRGGLEISAVGVDERPNYPLNLFVIPGRELFLWVSFEHRRFEEAAVERLLGHLRELLRGFASNPDAALGCFPLLTAAEAGQALAGWNERWAERPPVSVQALIEAQAARRPEAPGVVYEGAGLTYGELNRRANRLAHHLRRLGVGPEVPVGICLERSLDLIVAVLAVMKAGGAYLPVDIALSSQRMAFVLDDAGVPLVLTRQLLARDLPARPGLTALAIDAPWDAGVPADDANPPVATVPENACYLIYTSGSTGRPKGVVVRHAGWLNSYLGWEEDYRLPEIAAHLQMAAFSFDVFAGDLVRALCSGGKLVLCPRELLLEPAKLYQLMRDEGVEAAEFVPAVVRGLVQHLEATGGRLDFMRLMVCGSDAWYGREFEQLRLLCGPATRLINSYGVSEATIDSSYYEDTGAALGPDALVPIGKPFRACRLLVVAPDLALLPVGVAGELCLGGAGLGRGYLARPELTAEKFVPDPFAAGLSGGRPGDRLYRTGDRARWLPTGDVEFLGRVDHQVKVRGFRVEPGEIESVLGTHPAVRQAAVVARPEPSGERRLVGYVAFRPEAVPPGIQELRDYLRERLPDYMVPSAFAILDALPLTASGKIDRRALPEPEGGRPDLDASYVEPRTQAEEVIAGIFATVLNLQRVGVEDNFFELGGHSLLATQVVSRVREAFEVDLPLRALFDAPVVARLALAVEDLILRELEELGDEDLELAGEAGDSP